MNKRIHLPRSFFSTVLFSYLIPVVFLLEKYRQAIGTVSLFTLFYCLLLYWSVTFLFAIGFWRIFRNDLKAHLMISFLLIGNCYFGDFQAYLAEVSDDGMISKYRFTLPLTILCFIFFFYFLYKTSHLGNRTGKALSIIYIVLISVKSYQVAETIKHSIFEESFNLKFKPFQKDTLPDIFILVSDGYAGNYELRDKFSYKNDSFYHALRRRGFWVADSSRSNYSITPFSMASAFSMTYLPLTKLYHIDLINARKRILHNPLFDFLNYHGYELRNYSIFQDEEKKNDKLVNAFQFDGFQLLNAGTLLQHLSYLIKASVIVNEDFFYLDNTSIEKIKTSNRYVLESLNKEAAIQTENPRLIYGHILGPHFPYVFDSSGNYYTREELESHTRFSKPRYVSYLRGLNKIYLTTIDSIQAKTNGKAIILLISDHGFRQFKEPEKIKYYFSNLLTIYTPEKNYSNFYEGISTVNFFRAFLNQKFNQDLPMLKDSMVVYPIKGLRFKKGE